MTRDEAYRAFKAGLRAQYNDPSSFRDVEWTFREWWGHDPEPCRCEPEHGRYVSTCPIHGERGMRCGES